MNETFQNLADVADPFETGLRLTGVPLVCERCGMASSRPGAQYCGICQGMVDFRPQMFQRDGAVSQAPGAAGTSAAGHVPRSVRRVTLTLPYPLSANRYWRSFVPRGASRAVTTLSQDAKDYRAEVARIAQEMGVTEPIIGRVHIDVKLYPERPQDWQKRMRKDGPAWDDTVRCLDLDNARKVAYDSLKGVVIDDDKWVRSDSAERMEPDEHGARLVVTVTALAVQTPQAGLFGE